VSLRRGLVATLLLATACSGRPHSPTLDSETSATEDEHKASGKDTARVLEFDLTSPVPETQGAGLFLPVAASKTYSGLIREIERAATDKNARGYFLRLGDGALGWAHAEELGLAFQRLREKSGKPVVCHAHTIDNRAAWFTARACSKVWLSPAGDVDTVGIAGQVVYLKGALDKLKIRADFLHMGKYKSAAETLTQEGPTPEARESLTAVLASIRATWLEGYSSVRKGDATIALEDGPYSPEDGKAHGLVDAIGYESDARHDAEAASKVDHSSTAFGNRSSEESPVVEVLRAIAGTDGSPKRPHIAVLPAEGSIAMGSSSALSDSGITAKSLERVIRKLAADDAVKAVVLRIDSPGGSALASDLLWHDLMELRKKKPLVASVGDMAASGGYYLACAANQIVAERTSIVGSIGVLGGKIEIDEALAEYGVHAETFAAKPDPSAGIRATYMSPLSPWDDPTRERVRKQMEAVYELFLGRVATGRGLPVEAVRAVAEGRIWSGVQGQQLKLVDELGGLGRALEIARKLASLGADAPVRVEGASSTMLENLLGGDGAESRAHAEAVLGTERAPSLLDHVAANVRPFIGALAPLLDGEPTVTALPFALILK
jgi:protease-4